MTDLAAWLLEQIDTDEQVARAAGGGVWRQDDDEHMRTLRDSDGYPVVYDEGSPSDEEFAHIATWDPARILAECEAKRRIVEEMAEVAALDPEFFESAVGPEDWIAKRALRLLASVYADRPGYDESWRP